MQVDFYIMKSADFTEGKMFICQLIEKAYQHKHPILLRAENVEVIDFFDQALWTFSPTSFIPHQVDDAHPLEIRIGSAFTQKKMILLNLAPEPIVPNESIARLLQIVPNQPKIKERARELYRHYLQQNFKMNTHPIEQ